MHRLWDTLIKELVGLVPARAVVEIGSQHGWLTERLLEHYAPWGTVVHVIDPAPAYDPVSWSERYGGQLVFHRDLSLKVLAHLPPVDVVFLDGDHNWYTVHHELLLLEERAHSAGEKMPVVLLHDVDWPYGRRDLYYDPESIPSEGRQPHRRAGLLPGRSEVVDGGGLNDHLVNATHEGGPRNGVRTAVEDFLDVCEEDVEALSVPGFHGLSVLAPQGPLLEKLRSLLADPVVLLGHLQTVEDARLAELTRAGASAREVTSLTTEVRGLRASEASAGNELGSVRRELEAARSVRRELEAARASTRKELDIVRRELEAARAGLKDNQRLSKSLNRSLKDITHDVHAARRRDPRFLVGRAAAMVARRPQATRKPSVIEHLQEARATAREIGRRSKRALSPDDEAQPAALDTRSAAERRQHDFFREQMRQVGMPIAHAELPVPIERTGALRERGARPDERPTVDVVVCVHDALHDVWRCLGALFDAAGHPYHLIVVDDGSAPPTRTFLERFAKDNPSVTLLQNVDPPHGYTIAANLGLEASRGDYVVFLNSDTIVTRGWLDRLVACGESEPEVGIFGPLSNAASHQSVPCVRADEGGWATNPLPPWLTPDAMALLVADAGRRTYPRLPFINGFCYVVKRAVIDRLGPFDDERFAAGYCEENDYSQRARLAGYELAVAADTYVFHAKSRSYGAEGRRPIAKEHYRRFTAKHGEGEIKRLVDEMEEDRALAPLRDRLTQATADVERFRQAFTRVEAPSLRVLFVLPGLSRGGGGGSHSVYQEALALRALGVEARVALAARSLDRARSLYEDAEDVFLPYDDGGFAALAEGFDVLVATHYRSVAMVAAVAARREDVLPAYYVQDYEPFFMQRREEEFEVARASYTAIPQQLLFAKTRWLCEMVGRQHAVRVAKVEPSLDRAVYHAQGRHDPGTGPLRIVAMVRPRTPRRQPYRTLALLQELAASLGQEAEVGVFGCEPKDLRAYSGVGSLQARHLGVLSRDQVADTLRAADVFVDLSAYQAFGRTALEAMACGCVPVVPLLGGAHEFAQDDHNAIVVDTADSEGAFSAVVALASDRERLSRLRTAGLETAGRYSTHAAAFSEYLLFAEEVARRRAGAIAPPVHPQRQRPAPIEVSKEETARLVGTWIQEKTPVAVVRFGEGEGRLLVADPGDPLSMGVAARKLKRQTGRKFSPEEVLAVKALVMNALDHADVVGIRGSSNFRAEHQEWVERIETVFEERILAGASASYLSHCLLSTNLKEALPDLIGGAQRLSVVSCRDLRGVFETQYEVQDVNIYQVPSQYIMRRVDDEYEALLYGTPFNLDFYRELLSRITVRQRGEVFLVGAGIFGKDLCIHVKNQGGIALDLGSCLDSLAGKVTRGAGRPAPYRAAALRNPTVKETPP